MLSLQQHRVNTAISKSPGVALAAPVSANELLRDRRYKIHYVYHVDGTTYQIDSGAQSFNKKEAAAARTMPSVEVVYDKTAPSVAALKRDYQRFDLRLTSADALLASAQLALVISSAAVLLLSWKHRRSNSTGRRNRRGVRSRRSKRHK